MKRSGWNANDRILASVILCVLSFAVMLTGGYIAEKRQSAYSDIRIERIVEETDAAQTSLTAENAAAAIAGIGTESSITTSQSEAAAQPADFGKVNINTASLEELDTLDGVGEKTAQKIIDYRSKTPFEKPEDIMNVDGIGEKKFEKIKDRICV